MLVIDPPSSLHHGHHEPQAVEPDAELLEVAHTLRGRASGLDRIADAVPALASTAVRRRARELELAAWVAEIRSGVPAEVVRPAA